MTWQHVPGVPLRTYVRTMIEINKDEPIEKITMYGISIDLELTVNKTMRNYYSSVEHQARVKKLGYEGHPLFYRNKLCTTYST